MFRSVSNQSTYTQLEEYARSQLGSKTAKEIVREFANKEFAEIDQKTFKEQVKFLKSVKVLDACLAHYRVRPLNESYGESIDPETIASVSREEVAGFVMKTFVEATTPLVINAGNMIFSDSVSTTMESIIRNLNQVVGTEASLSAKEQSRLITDEIKDPNAWLNASIPCASLLQTLVYACTFKKEVKKENDLQRDPLPRLENHSSLPKSIEIKADTKVIEVIIKKTHHFILDGKIVGSIDFVSILSKSRQGNSFSMRECSENISLSPELDINVRLDILKKLGALA